MIPDTLVTELRAVAPVRENEPLSRHTTFGIGGPADLYVKVETVDALVRVLNAARRSGVPWFILGAGSNLLVGDHGIRGIVIEYDAKAVTGPERLADGRARFRVEAGASFAVVARRLARAGYSGLEWAVGIPGTLGGAMVTNAGAYGSSLSDCLVSVLMVEPGEEPEDLPAAGFQLAYRESVFTRGLARDVAVAAVTLDLRPADPAATMARVAEYDAHRTAAQPAGRNSGSVFKNPPGDSAWRLIDAAGLRGYRSGDAQITEKHTNFFANLGHARAADVKALMDLAQHRVRERFGIELEPEVRLVGEGFGEVGAGPSLIPSTATRERGATPERGATSETARDAESGDVTGPAASLEPGSHEGIARPATDQQGNTDARSPDAAPSLPHQPRPGTAAVRDVEPRLASDTPLPRGGGGDEGGRRPRRRVAVLLGGRSGEHSISLISGRSVLRFLDRERYEVVPIGVTRSGVWLTPPETGAALARIEGETFAMLEAEGEGLLARPELLGLLRDVDIVFPMLHGHQGEDGTVQGLLELAGVPYVGAGGTACAGGMDKALE
jgi:UDP-N-acetylmuramate dehydrogenase